MSQNTNNNYPSNKDIWDCQGRETFVKAYPMFASLEEDKWDSRVHLSFVKHNGRDNGAKQVDAIEIYIPVVKAGSNGKSGAATITGQNVLSLISLINDGTLAKMAKASREEAKANGQQYARDIFNVIGGSPAKVKDGVQVPAKFREFSIAPASSGKGYVMKAAECDGQQSANGGFSPAPGAQKKMIMVQVSELYMRTFAKDLEAKWVAHQTAKEIAKLLQK